MYNYGELIYGRSAKGSKFSINDEVKIIQSNKIRTVLGVNCIELGGLYEYALEGENFLFWEDELEGVK